MDGILIPYITRVKQVFFLPPVAFFPIRFGPFVSRTRRGGKATSGNPRLFAPLGSKATTDPGRWASENQSYKGPHNSTDFEVV